MKPQVRSYLVQSSTKATQSKWHEKFWAFHILLKEPVGCRLENNATNKNSQWNKDLWLNGIVESQAGATNPELHPGHDKQCSSGKCPDWGAGVLAAGLYQEVDLVTERRNGPPRARCRRGKDPRTTGGLLRFLNFFFKFFLNKNFNSITKISSQKKNPKNKKPKPKSSFCTIVRVAILNGSF